MPRKKKESPKQLTPWMPAVIGARTTEEGKHITYQLPAAEIVRNIDEWLESSQDVIQANPGIEEKYLRWRERARRAIAEGRKYIHDEPE